MEHQIKHKVNKEALEAYKSVKLKSLNEQQIVNKNENKNTGISNKKR